MTRNLTILSAFVLAFPIAIEAPYDSGGTSGHATRVSIAGGVGSYAMIVRDCEGRAIGSQPVHFRDAGADVEQQVIGPLHLGVRGGTVRVVTEAEHRAGSPDLDGPHTRSDHYVNPYLAIEGPHAGFGVGTIHSSDRVFEVVTPAPRFSGHVRFGGPNKYFSTSLMENLPLSSGGGYFDIGAGFRPSPRVNGWIGLSGGPYDGAGVALKTAWQMNPSWTLDANARLGVTAGEPQTGVALGITSRFGRPSGKAPGPVPAQTPPGAP